VSKPHLRKEKVLDGPCGPVYAWACRTIESVGFGQHWRTAHYAWYMASQSGVPVAFHSEDALRLEGCAYADRTLQ
jgi:hypothetical protein